MKEYDPLLYREPPTSKKHPRMSRMARAAQFAPFAALVGFEDELAERRRTTEDARELDIYESEEISRKLRYLSACPEKKFSLSWFVPDEKKSGGAYHTAEGYLARIDEIEGLLHFADGRTIPIEKIVKIEVYENESTQ